jgi:CheY-like chemotaxis protein
MRILIVEDNGLVAMDIECQLLDAGHEVVGIAATAIEAIEIGRAETPELALMDVSLADGSNGVDAAGRLKGEFGIPSVFITATLPDRPEVRHNGIGHLSKPFTEEEVVRAVEVIAAVLSGCKPGVAPARLHLFT